MRLVMALAFGVVVGVPVWLLTGDVPVAVGSAIGGAIYTWWKPMRLKHKPVEKSGGGGD